MTEHATAVREAMQMRERLAEIIAIVRSKAADPGDTEQAAAVVMLSELEHELAETDAGLRRVGIMQ